MTDNRYGPAFQRNALAPGIIAAVAILISQLLFEGSWSEALRYILSILALIVAWFAVQARHWWWIPVFLAIAIAWNPAWPFAFEGTLWDAAHYVAALAFLAAGILIKAPRADSR